MVRTSLWNDERSVGRSSMSTTEGCRCSGMVMEKMTSIQRRYHTIYKQKSDPLPSFPLLCKSTIEFHVATNQRMRETLSDLLSRSGA
ncbi:hypothetical protein TNCV_944601 [Trichonephila clavipes]|nr:hypothetical protein TNCV_944601 [Trichonephila clavipes]